MSPHDENKKKSIDITGKKETVQCIETEQRDQNKNKTIYQEVMPL